MADLNTPESDWLEPAPEPEARPGVLRRGAGAVGRGISGGARAVGGGIRALRTPASAPLPEAYDIDPIMSDLEDARADRAQAASDVSELRDRVRAGGRPGRAAEAQLRDAERTLEAADDRLDVAQKEAKTRLDKEIEANKGNRERRLQDEARSAREQANRDAQRTRTARSRGRKMTVGGVALGALATAIAQNGGLGHIAGAIFGGSDDDEPPTPEEAEATRAALDAVGRLAPGETLYDLPDEDIDTLERAVGAEGVDELRLLAEAMEDPQEAQLALEALGSGESLTGASMSDDDAEAEIGRVVSGMTPELAGPAEVARTPMDELRALHAAPRGMQDPRYFQLFREVMEEGGYAPDELTYMLEDGPSPRPGGVPVSLDNSEVGADPSAPLGVGAVDAPADMPPGQDAPLLRPPGADVIPPEYLTDTPAPGAGPDAGPMPDTGFDPVRMIPDDQRSMEQLTTGGGAPAEPADMLDEVRLGEVAPNALPPEMVQNLGRGERVRIMEDYGAAQRLRALYGDALEGDPEAAEAFRELRGQALSEGQFTQPELQRILTGSGPGDEPSVMTAPPGAPRGGRTGETPLGDEPPMTTAPAAPAQPGWGDMIRGLFAPNEAQASMAGPPGPLANNLPPTSSAAGPMDSPPQAPSRMEPMGAMAPPAGPAPVSPGAALPAGGDVLPPGEAPPPGAEIPTPGPLTGVAQAIDDQVTQLTGEMGGGEDLEGVAMAGKIAKDTLHALSEAGVEMSEMELEDVFRAIGEMTPGAVAGAKAGGAAAGRVGAVVGGVGGAMGSPHIIDEIVEMTGVARDKADAALQALGVATSSYGGLRVLLRAAPGAFGWAARLLAGAAGAALGTALYPSTANATSSELGPEAGARDDALYPSAVNATSSELGPEAEFRADARTAYIDEVQEEQGVDRDTARRMALYGEEGVTPWSEVADEWVQREQARSAGDMSAEEAVESVTLQDETITPDRTPSATPRGGAGSGQAGLGGAGGGGGGGGGGASATTGFEDDEFDAPAYEDPGYDRLTGRSGGIETEYADDGDRLARMLMDGGFAMANTPGNFLAGASAGLRGAQLASEDFDAEQAAISQTRYERWRDAIGDRREDYKVDVDIWKANLSANLRRAQIAATRAAARDRLTAPTSLMRNANTKVNAIMQSPEAMALALRNAPEGTRLSDEGIAELLEAGDYDAIRAAVMIGVLTEFEASGGGGGTDFLGDYLAGAEAQ